jgi:metal-dependent HD superfamily phosphatase/phosphodiesterase
LGDVGNNPGDGTVEMYSPLPRLALFSYAKERVSLVEEARRLMAVDFELLQRCGGFQVSFLISKKLARSRCESLRTF